MIDTIYRIADSLDVISNLLLLWIGGKVLYGYTYKKVNLSIGVFKIKRKDYTVQNLTNIVSVLYYGGGQVPPNVRAEIINLTLPKVK